MALESHSNISARQIQEPSDADDGHLSVVDRTHFSPERVSSTGINDIAAEMKRMKISRIGISR